MHKWCNLARSFLLNFPKWFKHCVGRSQRHQNNEQRSVGQQNFYFNFTLYTNKSWFHEEQKNQQINQHIHWIIWKSFSLLISAHRCVCDKFSWNSFCCNRHILWFQNWVKAALVSVNNINSTELVHSFFSLERVSFNLKNGESPYIICHERKCAQETKVSIRDMQRIWCVWMYPFKQEKNEILLETIYTLIKSFTKSHSIFLQWATCYNFGK